MRQRAGCSRIQREESIVTGRDTGWYKYYREGVGYMTAAENSLNRPGVFTPVIVYNVASMAIEKLCIAAAMYSGRMPVCSTLAGMAEFAGINDESDEMLYSDLVRMDSMQDICSMDEARTADPGADDVPFFIDVVRRVFMKTEILFKPGDGNDRAQEKHNHS